jgi:hypothetical protein
MQNENHSILLGAVSILALLCLGLFGIYADTHSINESLQQPSPTVQQVGGAGFTLQCIDSTLTLATTTAGYSADCAGTASSSPFYLGSGLNFGTTTILTANISHASAADVNLTAQFASTTSAIQNYSFWVSYNNMDWYPLQSNVSSTLTGNAAASSTVIHLSNLNDNYLQIRARAMTSSSTVYAQLIARNEVTQ